jgi:hypothetical protein
VAWIVILLTLSRVAGKRGAYYSWLIRDFVGILPMLDSNCNPPNIHLLNSYDYKL